MTDTLTLATRKPFGTLECDFYKGNDNKEFYMTREQVGTALEYDNPRKQIAVIHTRNADRLDPLSRRFQIETPSGKQEMITYTLRGVMEICRYSRQPKADKFMDFVWDVMESLYNGRNVYATPDQQSAVSPQTMQLLLDSMLKTQLETTRCMVAMTNTMSAMADRILNGMIQPVAVATPVEAAPEPAAPAAPVAEPKNESDSQIEAVAAEPIEMPTIKNVRHRGTTSEWRQDVYDTVARIRANQPDQWPTNTSVLSYVYNKMRDNYGFVVDEERKKYNERCHYSGKVAVITLVQVNTTWSEIFDSILNDLYNASITEYVHRKDAERKFKALSEKNVQMECDANGVPPPLYVHEMNGTTPATNPTPAPAAAPESLEESIKRHVAENGIKINGAAKAVAERINDKSARMNYSYRLIYREMNLDWDEVVAKFRSKFNRGPLSKADVVRHYDKLTQSFIAASDEIVRKYRK